MEDKGELETRRQNALASPNLRDGTIETKEDNFSPRGEKRGIEDKGELETRRRRGIGAMALWRTRFLGKQRS